ncbi:MAG: phage major capsid protein [Rhodoferax sp.]|nr:phage major capsid protein [Rhodoferax sp.]MCP5263652.1 phage major capsid protein [Rhodoferax sp.]
MKISRSKLTIAFLAVAFLAIVAALLGHPLVPPELLAGLGAMPFAVAGETTSMDTLADLVRKQGETLEEWRKKQESKLKAFESDLVELAKKGARPGGGGAGGALAPKNETWIDAKSGKQIQILSNDHRMLDQEQSSQGNPSVGRLLRGLVLGGRADDARELEDERKAMGGSVGPDGGFTVTGALSAEWIDRLRSKMVLVDAGARTVPMPAGTLSLARVTGDPTISWHGENHDITATKPTLGQVTLTARTVVCLVKMSLELSQDSANIEQILSNTITQAMANAIDSAGLVGVNVDAGAAPSGITGLDGRNTVTSIGAPTTWDFLVDGMYELLADNVPMESIGAMVSHPAVWKKMRKLKTGITNDNTPLMAPDEVAKLRKLWTTAAPLSGGDATAVIADWRDLLFGVRKDITVRVLSETFMGSNLQIAMLAYARVDFAATRAQSFCTLEGITV